MAKRPYRRRKKADPVDREAAVAFIHARRLREERDKEWNDYAKRWGRVEKAKP